MSHSQPKAKYDTPWKIILDNYFEDFMAYCWPQKYTEIDWSKRCRKLDKELSQITRDSTIGNRVLDKLIEIHRKDGQVACILLHLEVQGNFDSDFAERMFIYRYRLRDLYPNPIASLAILIDKNKKWRPGIFREELWDSSLEMRFPIIKIIDYKNRQEELEASSNPFAQVILAQLTALEKQQPNDRYNSKFALIKNLYKQKWQKSDIIKLMTFIDWVIALPEELEQKCREAIHALEEENKVKYITSFERLSREEGVEEGIHPGRMLLIRLLEHKFKTIPKNYKEQIEHASPNNLLQWGEKVLDCEALEEIFES